jgi:hypothetical protein
MGAPRWTEEEKIILSKVYPTEGQNGAALYIDKDPSAIRKQAHRMGIKTIRSINAKKKKKIASKKPVIVDPAIELLKRKW